MEIVNAEREQITSSNNELYNYVKRIVAAVNYKGNCDHEDVPSILRKFAEGYEQRIKELTEENERLREKADRTLENLKAVLEERSENTIVADTVQKYKSAIIEYYSKPKYQPTKEHPIKHTQIEHLFAVLDKKEKEMLEGKQ